MTLELDDVWLEKMEGLRTLTLVQKRRLYRVIMVGAVGASYLVDMLLLGLFALAGTIELSVLTLYGLGAVGHMALFSGLHWSGFSERFANPHMTVWQMVYAVAVQLMAMAIAPQLTQLFLGILFVVFAFATLRIALRETLIVWLFACLAIAIVLTLSDQENLGIMMPSKWEQIVVAVSFATILLRSIGLGYYATTLRMRIYEKSHSLERAATYDTLTGTLNRSVILPAIKEQISLRQRKQIPTCVAMLDIDRFKRINDTFGHPAGDAVLKKLAKDIHGSIRETDKLGRYGGEEFVVLLPATGIEDGAVVMERIRSAIASSSWHEIAEELSVTASCGIAEIRPSDTVEDAVGRADRALYNAKHRGRNRVCRAD